MRSVRRLLALAFLLTFPAMAPSLSAAEGAGLSVSVSIAPVADRSDDCLCTMEIADLADGKVIASPNVIVRKGEAGRVSVGDHATYALVVDLSVDKAGTAATYAVTYSRKDVVVAVQKGALSIRCSS